MSALCIDGFRIIGTDKPMTFKELGIKVRELRGRIQDELSLCLLLQVESGKSDLYENADPFVTLTSLLVARALGYIVDFPISPMADVFRNPHNDKDPREVVRNSVCSL